MFKAIFIYLFSDSNYGKPKSVALAVLFLLSIWMGNTGKVCAQTYPVQITTQLVPPFSAYLPDYADPGSEKIKVILQFNDFSVSQYNLKLKFEIKGNGFTLRTKSFFNGPPITLNPGQPVLLSSAEIAPYLNSNNLDFIGINQSQYEQRMALPEGYYSICVTAYDFYNNNNIQVSNESCAQAWFTLSDPPFLNLPLCNSNVVPLTPQNILFQWTPMNMGSPNSFLNTEYEFALWECRPDTNANPNQIVLSTQPIYSITTQQTFINYGISEPNLNLYMKYVWRVRAKDITGRDWFKNNGYSQICTFKYGTLENILGESINLTLNAQTLSHRSGQCYWNKQSVYTDYLLQVKKQGTEYWFDYPNLTGIEKIPNLEPNTSYEARVRGEGNGVTGKWSNIAMFKTGAAPTYSCENTTMPYNTAAPDPLPFVKAISGLIFQSGQFEIMTTKIEANGSPGWFKGAGYAFVFNKRVAVKWDNIYIDFEARHQQGEIQALTSGVDKWLEQWDLMKAEENAHYAEGEIDTLVIKGNKVCYTFQGSDNEICVPSSTNSNMMIIRDAEGNQYNIKLIPPPAKVTGPTSYLNYSTDSLAANDSVKVIFEASTNQNFGFDKKEYAAFIKNYEAIKLKTGKNYFVSNKSIGVGATDEAIAVIQITNFNSSQLIFKKKDGSVLSTSPGANPNQIKITGIVDDADCIYAWYKGKKVGKLNVVGLKAITKKVVFVPVNNASVPIAGGQDGAAALNGVFKQANVSWSVTVANSFSFNLGVDGLEAADANLISKYSNEMRSLRNGYQAADTAYDKNAYYVFVVSAFSSQDMKGYMVRGRAVGFIKAGANVKEITHELAHGAFALEHTFPKADKNTTNNLMDYNSGIQLVKEQWNEMQNNKFVYSWRDEEEDASFVEFQTANNVTIFETLKMIKRCYNENKTMPVTQFVNGRENLLKVEKTYLAGIQYDFIHVYKELLGNTKTQINPKTKMITEQKTWQTGHGGVLDCSLITVDDVLCIEVPQNRASNMEIYLKSPEGKNLILFVNGYRPNTPSLIEKPNSLNKIYNGDVNGYWAGIDAEFMNRIKTKNAVYADGHHSVSTANHLTQGMFLSSMASSMDPSALTRLNTTPNTSGFNTRKNYGRVAGYDFVVKLNNNSLSFNKANDTLDIVAHSMGYAYALGIIEVLQANAVKFGRFYILAPENACSGGTDWKNFMEVYQYGSNLGMPNPDPMKEQDGVAPQCECPGLVGSNDDINSAGKKLKAGRIKIPGSIQTKGFTGSHTIDNYNWIFNIVFDPNTPNGHVKSRN